MRCGKSSLELKIGDPCSKEAVRMRPGRAMPPTSLPRMQLPQRPLAAGWLRFELQPPRTRKTSVNRAPHRRRGAPQLGLAQYRRAASHVEHHAAAVPVGLDQLRRWFDCFHTNGLDPRSTRGCTASKQSGPSRWPSSSTCTTAPWPACSASTPATMPLSVPVLRVLEACRGELAEGPLVRPLSGKPMDRHDCYRMVPRIAKAAGIPCHSTYPPAPGTASLYRPQ